jgi:hypothetical protein
MADQEPSGSPDSSYITPRAEWKKIASEMDEFNPGDPTTADTELLNKYIEAKAVTYEDEADTISDEALWDIFQQDFSGFTEEHFKRAYKKARIPTHLLRSTLRRAGVFILASNKKATVASTMATAVHEEIQHKWTLKDVKGLLNELKKGVVNSVVVKELMKTLEPPLRSRSRLIQEQTHEPHESEAESNVQDINTPSRPPRDLRNTADLPRDRGPLRNTATNPPRETAPVDTPAAHQYYGNNPAQYPPLPPAAQYQQQQQQYPYQPQQYCSGHKPGGHNAGYYSGYQPPQHQQTGYSGYTSGYNGFNGGYQSVNAPPPPSYPQIGYLQTGYAPYPSYQMHNPSPSTKHDDGSTARSWNATDGFIKGTY